jgi:polygalacturonase
MNNAGASATGGSVSGGTASGGVAPIGGSEATGGVAPIGGSAATGGAATGGNLGVGGSVPAGGTQGTGGSSGGTSAGIVCYGVPGAAKSPLYTVTVGGVSAPVEKFTKFGTEMQVHYAHCSLSGTTAADVAVTLSQTFSSYTLSPKSRNIAATKSGNTVTFSSGPNYLIFNVSGQELLFVLLDAEETNPPHLGDANVKNVADYTVDNTGATLVTSKVQSAINAASGATQSILYFPPGKYKVGELSLKSNMTLYLAGGAILYGSDSTSDFNNVSGGINIEGAQHALIRMYQIKNTQILGRGALDANGHAMRAAGLNANLLKIEQSSNITVDGIVSRDPSYWNTLIYRSDAVTIQNYKVINCRPTTTTYNQTDGVDFDESTNSKLFNAFLYTGDDGMATKNEEASGTINTKNITHEHIVVYNNSVGCKIGTKSMGQTMDGVTFKDVDVVKAGRALTIEAYDTAVVQNTTFEDIRVEAADSMLINIALDQPPDWRTAANTSIVKDTYFTNVSSDAQKTISLHGQSSSVNISGVHFSNLTIQGKAVTSQTDSDASWSINSYVSNITFK